MALDLMKHFKKFKEEQEKYEEAGADAKVMLIDGTNTYIRCFAASNQMDDNGEHVGGVAGFLKSVGLAVRQFRPTRVIVVFDGYGGSQRRRKLFKEYKDNRRTMEKLNRTYDFADKDEERLSMKKQMSLLVGILSKLPVSVMAIDKIEADDTIAYVKGLVEERGGKSIILSTDRDFLQLVGPNCEVYNPVKKKMYNESLVMEEYEIHPNNMLLYRIIEGDTSDNIPGVKGVGKKTLVKNFPYISEEQRVDLETILEDCYKENGKFKNKSCEKIVKAEEDGILSRNTELMDLSEVHISGNTKMKILGIYDDGPNDFDKEQLTLAVTKNMLGDAFGDFDRWVRNTWIPLIRFSEKVDD